MSEFYWIYIYTVGLGIANLAGIILGVTAAIAGVAMFFTGLALIDEPIDKVAALWEKAIPTIMKILIPCFFIVVFFPSKDDMKLIIGGGMTWKATQIEGIENIPENVVSAMNSFLVSIEDKDGDQ